MAARTRGNPDSMQYTRSLFSGTCQIATMYHVTDKEEKQAWDLFVKLNSDPDAVKRRGIVRFVDCTNVVLCRERRIRFIPTPDGHYRGFLEYPS
ncbi:MAG: hypothetical protein ACTSU5_02075 [Promethearchaeota archaeon]